MNYRTPTIDEFVPGFQYERFYKGHVNSIQDPIQGEIVLNSFPDYWMPCIVREEFHHKDFQRSIQRDLEKNLLRVKIEEDVKRV